MKLNKAMLILAAAGLLTSAASYAADTTATTSGPQEATATLVVQSTATFNHDLQPASGIVAGKLADDAVLANGTVQASQTMQKVKLSWVRAVNPELSGQDGQYAQLLPVGSKDQTKAIPVMFKPVLQPSQSQSDNDAAVYTLATPAQTFGYQIVNAAGKVGKGDVTISAGHYQMTVDADVVFA
ncbi:hypothetical protein [Escherichia coli]|uniref:hypothetical protein n=1 Tax=Escherichia coli TaxID=562 RepID=UPI001918BDA9|nr:hypothetical protein [Escherichia coli]CAD6107070.1 Uncharacterised protein [Escherichia coli]CAD6111330.1 Uncharacterised protein [Escherichia coli]CAD6181107.1 Uncharacterised protein [Escherichia coli]